MAVAPRIRPCVLGLALALALGVRPAAGDQAKLKPTFFFRRNELFEYKNINTNIIIISLTKTQKKLVEKQEMEYPEPVDPTAAVVKHVVRPRLLATSSEFILYYFFAYYF
jgi:hypothetical protein